MPIIIPEGLPAAKILSSEGVFIIGNKRAIHQDIRPLRIAIVNLMPNKEVTETQLLRLLSNTPLQVHIDLIRTKSHHSKNTVAEHLEQFYKNIDDIKNAKYDGMIITGAPVEKLNFEEVDYWEELQEVMEYARSNVYSTIFICWAAQAALYHYYNIPKYVHHQKISGVFSHRILRHTLLTRGFDDYFDVPHSRYSSCKISDVKKHREVITIASSDKVGPHIMVSKDHRFIFLFGHCEYDKETLDLEYQRDANLQKSPEIPNNYYLNDEPGGEIRNTWKAHANLLFSNWLNYCVYQKTPYNIENIEKKIVAKFGGSSLANSIQIAKVKNIVKVNPYQYVVVSAPGKAHKYDIKVTDLLIELYENLSNNENWRHIGISELSPKVKEILARIRQKFVNIINGLKLQEHLINVVEESLEKAVLVGKKDFIVSRGEYLSARIISEYLDFKFIDAKDIIFFTEGGHIDGVKTQKAIKQCMDNNQRVVIPGFYGVDSTGNIKTFQRGGSDITGSIIAWALDADIYANWTDVNGVMTADPKIDPNAAVIEKMSYDALLDMVNKGAQVYHPDAINHLKKVNIPIIIKNTNNPYSVGTWVEDEF